MEEIVSRQTPESSSTQSPPSSLSNRGTILYLLLLIAALAAIFFAYQNFQMARQIADLTRQIQALPSPTPSPTIPSTLQTSPADVLPPGWTYQSNGECGVEIPVPPPQNQAINWDFPRGGVYPNLLSKLPNGYDNHKQSPIMYAPNQGDSGNILSAVIVSCLPNTDSLINSQLLSSLEDGFELYNEQDNSFRMEANNYSIASSTEAGRWGHSVLDLVIDEYSDNSGGEPYTKSVEYTIFTTNDFMYEVKSFGNTQDQPITETANQIFQLLKFN